MPAMSNKTLCLLLWGTQSEDDPVVSGPRHRATKRHMTTPGHIQSISKGTRNYMLQRSLFFPLPVSFLEWFISPALLSSTWQNTTHIHYCPLTTSPRRCHGNVRPCLLLCRSHCLFPGTAKHMFSHRPYDALPASGYLLISIPLSEVNNKIAQTSRGWEYFPRPWEGWPSFIAVECLWSMFLSWTGKIQSSVWLFSWAWIYWAYCSLCGNIAFCLM